jgi:hypothetical protein
MTNPITPPPELVDQWIEQFKGDHPIYVAIQAAQWGADQELEACCAAVRPVYGKLKADWLRSVRRPKPPSLKAQALVLLNSVEVSDDGCSSWDFDIIRRALEQLDD